MHQSFVNINSLSIGVDSGSFSQQVFGEFLSPKSRTPKSAWSLIAEEGWCNDLPRFPSPGLSIKKDGRRLEIRSRTGFISRIDLSKRKIHIRYQARKSDATRRMPSNFRGALKGVFALCALEDGMIAMHGAAIVNHNKALLALGKSGVGKSTFAQHFSASEILADDFVLIDTAKMTLFGTPLFGEEIENPARIPKHAPLKHIAMLRQSKSSKSAALTMSSRLSSWLPHAGVPVGIPHYERKAFDHLLATSKAIKGSIFDLNLNPIEVRQLCTAVLG